MTCYLCQNNRKLCRSHIIPEFFYKPLYDANHKFLVIHGSKARPIRDKQKGFRERLLCESCEAILHRHEDYVCDFYNGMSNFYMARVGNELHLSNLNYTHFRLCFLSILWKMSISSHQMFNDVKLGSKHEEILRKMILNNDAGKPHEYGFIGVVPYFNGENIDLIGPPDCWRHKEGHRICQMMIGYFLLIFFISSHKIDQKYQKYFVQLNGTWFIKLKDEKNIDYCRKMRAFAEKFLS